VLFAIAAISILGTGQAYAQVTGATLTGTVKDSSGAVIPNAQVVIMDVATGVTRTVSPGSAGLYTAPNLLPGTYEVRTTATGFSTAVQKGITLTVGAQQVLDITMQVGQMNQTVEVTTEAPTVELTSSELGATVNATTVRELPLNGRSWTDLANLQPGVVAAQTHASGDVNRGYGAQLSISGARPQQNNYRLDGISINDYSNGGPGSVLGQNLGVEAIQEFSVLTSNYSAEYGKTSGGVVNAISRSGTNQFHGSVYEFLRNSALDAPGYFEGDTPPPFRLNQFGASAGGPIRKDRTFIFGDYEGVRESKGVTVPVPVPSLAARGLQADGTTLTAAVLCSHPEGANPPNSCSPHPVTGAFNPDPTTGIDQAAQKYLPFFHLPDPATGSIGNGDFGLYTPARQRVVSENYFTVRVDQKISASDSLFGTYMYDYSPSTAPDILNNVLQQSIAKRQVAAIEESHIFSPTLVNSFRVGYNRDRANALSPIKAINPVATVGVAFTALPITATGCPSLTQVSGARHGLCRARVRRTCRVSYRPILACDRFRCGRRRARCPGLMTCLARAMTIHAARALLPRGRNSTRSCLIPRTFMRCRRTTSRKTLNSNALVLYRAWDTATVRIVNHLAKALACSCRRSARTFAPATN